jgi:tRNA modification GTPase
MTPPDILAALLTPLAPGAIAVVALRGPGVEGLLPRLFARRSGRPLDDLPDRRPTHCRLMDGGDCLDDTVVARLDGPGGPVVEVNVHGGVRIVQRLLMLLQREGAGVVSAEEFTGAGGILADIDGALRACASRRLGLWLLAQRRLLPGYLGSLGERPAAEVEAYRRRTAAATALVAGLRVALVGPPNAGKSTLANRLIGAERVLTSDLPGTTRDWVAEPALISGWPVTLTDTAGIRDTTCGVEAEAIRRSRRQAGLSDLALLVLDSTAAPDRQGADYEAVRAAMGAEARFIVVFNKCDREGSRPAALNGVETCRVSALTGAGTVDLEAGICRLLGLDLLDEGLPTGFLAAHGAA